MSTSERLIPETGIISDNRPGGGVEERDSTAVIAEQLKAFEFKTTHTLTQVSAMKTCLSPPTVTPLHVPLPSLRCIKCTSARF